MKCKQITFELNLDIYTMIKLTITNGKFLSEFGIANQTFTIHNVCRVLDPTCLLG